MTEPCVFNYRAYPRRINLGCGLDKRPDYLNVDLNDFHAPDLVGDVCDLPVLPSGYYEHILARDILEHLPRARCLRALREWNRLLARGGTLELQVPNVVGLLTLLTREDRQNFRAQEELLQCLFGTQAYRGDYHYNGFTEITLRQYLADAGFDLLVLNTREEWLFEAVAVKSAEVEHEAFYGAAGDADFLRAAYRALLGREPDAGGLAFYLERLRAGMLREEVVQALKNSPEYRDPATAGQRKFAAG
ncbi:DUF4214 domain-containing protein [Candidatus Methylocalor cossyra]|uniref:DUF4214 domain-containing protein n=1 Tax=Candidatus Methylocalor cossyra TaxID=3108543 RepID=A0ABM9NKE6_9GAMM